MNIRLAAKFEQEEDGGFSVFFPSSGVGGGTQGDGYEEAMLNAKNCADTILLSMYKDSGVETFNIFNQDKNEDEVWIYPSLAIRTALSLKKIRIDLGLSQKEAAKRLGIAQTTYRRFEDPEECNLTLQNLEKVTESLGYKTVIEFVAS